MGNVVSKRAKANTALVFMLLNATPDDQFILEFAPFDPKDQTLDNLKFTPVLVGGAEIVITTRHTPFTYVTPANGYYRVSNNGHDDTRAVCAIIDEYEVVPHVSR